MAKAIKLAYCEIDHIMLRPNTKYIFIPIEGCVECETKLMKYNVRSGMDNAMKGNA
jgi:hypothetical protein